MSVSVQRIALLAFLAVARFAWAGTVPNPADYPVTVHVSATHVSHNLQTLDVVIDRKKFQLQISDIMLFALGDYKAKLVKEQHRGGYQFYQIYELLFPDQKTRRFWVIGQSE